MPKKHEFKRGDPVSYDGHDSAYINFVCSDYIVVCTHEWPDEGTLHGIKQVNVLVYPDYYNTITPRSSNGTVPQEGTVHSSDTGCDRTTQAEA